MTQKITSGRIANSSITVNSFSTNFGGYAYDFDDISYITDGVTTIFPLTYNTSNVSVSSPWNLIISINGLLQSAFANTQEVLWMSHVKNSAKGYTLNDDGRVLFADPPPAGSDVMIRLVPGTPAQNTKIYPFKATDIFLGY
jgi:hypothetical protein